MAFKTFAPGVLTSSDVNTFLMRQAVITCTSSTRPASPSEGMTIYETDTDMHMVYSGSAWVPVVRSGAFKTFTPELDIQGGSGTAWTLGNGSLVGQYIEIGNLVFMRIQFEFGSTSAAGTGALAIKSLPIAIKAGSLTLNADDHGQCKAEDVSVTTGYPGQVVELTSTRVAVLIFGVAGSYATNDAITGTVPFTWDTGDELTMQFLYERA